MTHQAEATNPEKCRMYGLNLPHTCRALFKRIDSNNKSAAARKLIEFALANGAPALLPDTTWDLTPRARNNSTIPYHLHGLKLPESYRELFLSITPESASNACRALIEFALAHGALEALAPSPTAADVFASWQAEE